MSATAVRRTCLVAVVLVIALGAANIALWALKPGSDGLDGARSAALSSAKTRVPEILTYSYKTIDADIATASDQLTGKFKTDFTDLMKTQVRKGALAGKIITNATTVEAGVVSAKKTKVRLLLFLNLSTTSGTSATPQVNGSRVEVTMDKVHGAWLVSAVDPV